MTPSSSSHTFWSGLALAAFGLELLFFSVLRNVAGPFVSPMLFTGASLLFTFAAWRALRDQPYAWAKFYPGTPAAAGRWALVAGLLLLAFYPRLSQIFAQLPIDARTADALPSIEVYLRRLQNGQPIYALITDFGYDFSPTYLPMMWLPFLLPDTLNLDYRWLGIWVLGLGLVFYAARLAGTRPSLYAGALLLGLPFLLLLPLLGADAHVLGMSFETLIIGYYFILAAGILSGSTGLRAVGLVLCLLSRFSLLFWVPLYLWLIYRHESPRRAFWLAGLVGLGILGIYVLPFLSQDWSSFAKGQAYYTQGAIAEWQGNLNPQGQPTQLFQGLGLAAYFYQYLPGDVAARVGVLRVVHLAASAGSVAAVALWCWRRRAGLRLDYRHVALLALKLNLVVFYAFIQVPYDNLLLLVPALSVWVLLCLPDPGRAATPTA